MTQLADMQELQSRLLRYCLTITESAWEAEDLVQETCLKAIGLLKGTSVHANPAAYLFRIAKNTRIDQIRKQKMLQLKMNMIRQEEQHYAPDLFDQDVEAAIQVLIKCLSPMLRSVFLLRDVFGFTNMEAAKFLKTTEGAIKTALHRARYSLQEFKESLANEEILNAKEESEKDILRALLMAIQFADVPLLVQLSQNDALDPVMAIGMAQRHLSGRKRSASAQKETLPFMQMAA
jgi:RNA polymerase sigma factor (sigma-70 family)